MIVLNNVTKAYGKSVVLKGISLRIDPGEFVCIVGKSGAGKTTLLHLLLGAETMTKGQIEIDGVDLRRIPPPVLQLFRRRVGMVFQDYKLLPNLTVRENIAFPLEVCGISDRMVAKRTGELLEWMRLTKRVNALPRELSGGEKARTAIARAVAHKPMILLADEPTGNLDPEEAESVIRLFNDINREGVTVLLATHSVSLVEPLHPRIVRLADGVLTGDTEAALHPLTDNGAELQVFAGAEKKLSSGKRKVKVTSIHSEG